MSKKAIIAPNAFKNSLSAEKAAEAIADGFRQADPSWECLMFPIGDGGDGTGALLAHHLNARRVDVKVHSPVGDLIDAPLYLTKDEFAIIELADASGLRLVDRAKLDVMRSSTFGTGELIRSALDHGARKIILCVGGSATVDAGVGILQALGFRFLGASGASLTALPSKLHEVVVIDPSNADPRIFDCPIKVLVDVQTAISGPAGCARVFGPQKGASVNEIEILDHGLRIISEAIYNYGRTNVADMAGGGAAGGVAAMLCGVLQADLVNGIEYFLEITDFDSALAGAALVITGEGQLDDQTLQGKGPFGVAIKARLKGVRVVAVAGKIDLESNVRQYFDEVIPIQPDFTDLAKAMANTYENLKAIAKDIALKYNADPGS